MLPFACDAVVFVGLDLCHLSLCLLSMLERIVRSRFMIFSSRKVGGVVFCLLLAVLKLPLVVGFVVVTPSSPTFAVDAAEWNGANWTAVLPTLVYFVYSGNDAVMAIQDAIANGMQLVVRSGRHQYTGLRLVGSGSLANQSVGGGIAVVDVSNITGVHFLEEGRIDHRRDGRSAVRSVGSARRDVCVGVGERQYSVYQQAWVAGLLLPGGTCPTVGISGFALGGGYGFFGRKFSVTSDSIVGAEMVVVDALGMPHLVNVSYENADVANKPNDANVVAFPSDVDVLWGLQGGGNNNLGLVTRLILSLPQAPPMYAHVRISFSDIDDCVHAAMPLYDRIAPHAPPELYVQFVVYSTSCGIMAAMEGGAALLNATMLMSEWLDIPSASAEAVVELPYEGFVTLLAGCNTVAACINRTLQATPDPLHPSFFGAFSIYVDQALGSAGLATLYAGIQQKPTSLGFIFSEFDPYGPTGAVNQRNASDTAFPHRASLYHIQFMVYWDGVEATTTAHGWLQSVFANMSQYGNGSYRNYPSSWLPDAGARFYKGNLEALQSLRQQMDPSHAFLADAL